MYDIIILGAGPAGIYGTFYACFNGFKVLLIELDNEIGGKPLKLYPQKPIHDFPGLVNVTGKELVSKFVDQLNSLDEKNKTFEILKNVDINKVEKEDEIFKLFDTKNNVYKSKYVILATGYSSFKFKSLDENILQTKKEINYHIKNIEQFKNKDVVILGGGDSAIDYANMLSNCCKNISIIHRSNEYKAHKNSIEKVKEKNNIIFYSNYKIHVINDKKIVCSHNENNEKKEIIYDEILICYGIEMLKNNLSKTGLLNNIFKLEVDEKFESINHKNLFAIGNAKSSKNKDLIAISVSEIINVILEIMNKENKKINHHQ